MLLGMASASEHNIGWVRFVCICVHEYVDDDIMIESLIVMKSKGAVFVISAFLFVNYLSFHRSLDDNVDDRLWSILQRAWKRLTRDRSSYTAIL
jgi:hypothetical protein